MGFSHHPGALPLLTVRRQQWANRLQLGENIEIHGEHGCDMPPTAAKVCSIRPFYWTGFDRLLYMSPAYAGMTDLCVIELSYTDEPWIKVGESWQKVLDATKKHAP